MSAVDVLAVMDKTVSAIENGIAADDTANDLREARAAVVELMKISEDAVTRLWQSDNTRDRAVSDELEAALARCKGEGA